MWSLARNTWRRRSSDKGRSVVVRKVRELKVLKTSLLSYEGLGATSLWEERGSRESHNILLTRAAGGSMPRPPGATPELAVGALEPEADQCRTQEVTGLCCWGHGKDVLVGSSEPWSPPFFLHRSQFLCSLPSASPAQRETECHSDSLRSGLFTLAQQWYSTRAQISCLREQTASQH